jgi:hypothetical protein
MSFAGTKLILGIAASTGAASIVGNAIRMSTPSNLKLSKKIVMGIGGLALSGMFGNMASNYVASEIDEAVDAYKIFKDGIQKTKETIKNAKDAASKTSESSETE